MKPRGRFRGWLGLAFAILSGAAILCAVSLVLEFRLRSATTVIGHVLGVDGRPVPGATVYIQFSRMQGVPTNLQVTTSASDGTFRFHVANFHALTEIYARLPGRGVGVFRLDPDNWMFGVSLRDTHLVLRLSPVRHITARVVDWNGKPVVGVSVGPSIIRVNTSAFQPTAAARLALGAKTDASGRATLDSIPLAGDSTLEVNDDRFALSEVRVPYPDTNEVTIALEPACKVEGTVTLDGAPVRDLVLRWEGPRGKGDYDPIVTDRDGKFQIRRAPAGRLSFQDATFGKRENDSILPDTEVIADPASTRRVEIKMVKGTLLRIKVVDVTGKPVGGVQIRGTMAHPPFHPDVGPTRKELGEWGPIVTNDEGTTHIRLRPGKYFAIFSPHSHRGHGTRDALDVLNSPTQDVVLHLPPAEARNRLRVRVFAAEGYSLTSGLWYESESVGNGDRLKRVCQVAPDGAAEYNSRGQHVLAFRAQCADELSDLVVPPLEGIVVLKLRHVGFGAVTGVVRDEAGHVIARAQVQVDTMQSALAAHADDVYPYKVVTGPDGRFVFQGLYPGLQTCLTIRAGGYEPAETSLIQVLRGETQKLPDIVLQGAARAPE